MSKVKIEHVSGALIVDADEILQMTFLPQKRKAIILYKNPMHESVELDFEDSANCSTQFTRTYEQIIKAERGYN